MKTLLTCLTVAATAGLCSNLSAQTVVASVGATANATVQPGGVRTGASGTNYLNVEGTDAGGATYSSYGIIDFTLDSGSFSQQIDSVSQLSISLFQSNGSFSATGGIVFYIASDSTSSIVSGVSTLTFDTGIVPGGIAASGGQLGDLTPLGVGTFTLGSSGDVSTYTFDADTALSDMLMAKITSGSNIRVVVAATDPATAATWAGVTNSTYAGGTLSVTGNLAAVPEPSTWATLLMGIISVGFFGFRKKTSRV